MTGPHAPRLGAFLIWAAVAATAAHWGLRSFGPDRQPARALPVALAPALQGDPARLLVAAAPPDAAEPGLPEVADTSLRLLGIVAGRSPERGLAVLEAAGRPPRALPVGAVVDGSLVLQAVERRSVQLGPAGGPPTRRLSLPEPLAPATGVPGGLRGAVARPPGSPGPADWPGAQPPLPGAPAAVEDGLDPGPQDGIPMGMPPRGLGPQAR